MEIVDCKAKKCKNIAEIVAANPGCYFLGSGEEVGDHCHVTENGEIMGFGIATKNGDGFELNIGIKENVQRKGYGSAIVKYLEDEIKQKGKHLISGIILATNPKKEEIVKFMISFGYSVEGCMSKRKEEIKKHCTMLLKQDVNLKVVKEVG